MKKSLIGIIIIALIGVGYLGYTFISPSNNTTGTSTSNNAAGTSTSNNATGTSTSNNAAGTSTSNNAAGTSTSNNATGTNYNIVSSRIENINIAIPSGEVLNLQRTPNANSTPVPNGRLTGIINLKILGLVPNKNCIYVDYAGAKGFIFAHNFLAFANNYQFNVNTNSTPKPLPTGSINYTIKIPNKVIINAYKTALMNTAPALILKNTDRGTCTFLINHYLNNSVQIFYNNQILYINKNYLSQYYVPEIKMNDFIS